LTLDEIVAAMRKRRIGGSRSAAEQGKLYLLVAIGRTSKFAFVQLVEKANTCAAQPHRNATRSSV
jgi:hypothetical protein